MTELEVLDFGDCLLRTEGGKAIAQGIKEGHTKLKVSYQEIKWEVFNLINICHIKSH